MHFLKNCTTLASIGFLPTTRFFNAIPPFLHLEREGAFILNSFTLLHHNNISILSWEKDLSKYIQPVHSAIFS